MGAGVDEIFGSIRHNLAHLLSFSGRQTRAQFWPYAIFMFILSAVAGMLVFIPFMVDMFVRIQRYAIEHPEGPPVEPGPTGAPTLPPELMPDFSAMMVPMALVNLGFVLLLVAAIVRRLHDCDRAGSWALLPVPFMIFGQLKAPQITAMFTKSQPNEQMLSLLMLNSLFYWIALIALIILLVQEGTNGPNRFGEDPLGAGPGN